MSFANEIIIIIKKKWNNAKKPRRNIRTWKCEQGSSVQGKT